MCEKYDVAIIGGGVIGSSVAHFLAERGHKVAIVEKQSIASEASKACWFTWCSGRMGCV